MLILFFSTSVSFSQTNIPVYSPEKASFSIKFKGETSPYNTLGIYLLPSEKLKVQIIDSVISNSYSAIDPNKGAIKIQKRRWEWPAPSATGVYQLHIKQDQSGEIMTLNIFVMLPISRLKGGKLNGYRVGDYFWATDKDRPIYRPPKGFIEVTPENQDTHVSPHFTLKKFICKQSDPYPKYVVLRERLLLKLELILEKVNEAGYPCATFGILSGYRTPFYNKLIGNVKYSRHVWGDAADIYIDENPEDEMMDDLNQDGKIDVNDAGVLYEIIDRLSGKPFYTPFIGGLGRYKETPQHGPFVHIDGRGRRARWGD